MLAAEFALTNVQTDKLLATIGEMTVGEALVLALAAGPTKFVAGPLALLVEIVVFCDLIMFYSYLVLAQGQLRCLIRWSHILHQKDLLKLLRPARTHACLYATLHWLYSTLVFASGLFVGVDQVQLLYDSDRQLPWETARFSMLQQLADLTLAEVEDFVPAIATVLAPIFGAIGVSRYPTKPIAMAVLVHTVSICTYLQGSQPQTYPKVLSAIMSGEMPQAYTTTKTGKQLEENLMALLRARTRKASPLPRKHGSVNWFAAPLSLDGCPFRIPWSQEALRKTIKVSTSANPNLDPLYFFRCITFPNRY